MPEVAAALVRQVGDGDVTSRALLRLVDVRFFDLRPVDDALARRAATVARTLQLKGCDAVYVALAAMTGEPLATLDLEQRTRGAAVATMEQLP